MLSREQYHVLHFDLRIAGFADLASLYLSLSQQMELYFEEIAKKIEGYGEFEKEAWSFKARYNSCHYSIYVDRGPARPHDRRTTGSRRSERLQISQCQDERYSPVDGTIPGNFALIQVFAMFNSLLEFFVEILGVPACLRRP